jgi:hypothetical protein
MSSGDKAVVFFHTYSKVIEQVLMGGACSKLGTDEKKLVQITEWKRLLGSSRHR